jgi:hypothetical protein
MVTRAGRKRAMMASPRLSVWFPALAIADLNYRKRIIADEMQHHRRLVERFSKLSALG